MDRIQGYARVGSYEQLEKETLIELLNERDERIEYLLSEIKRKNEALLEAKKKAQIFASHIAYNKDKYYSLDPLDTFEKAQRIYEFLEEALKEQ